ncbi:tetratricopeptide repeat protein [Leptothoe kymatousa]|uniref:Tetratricopeptide repeat protein n=1 Tax=Leptothoe kymatousa TAU-MAC 1615 TaxID=2364775 RepID=A0ABS5Y2K7_9CYAN|nr:tetratricopeptide repeat protein [Leptothoe kymatousa]MBT9311851.1 tetratricopeptide repeat protein [Leptothoe kymatousa TAU-MAC 1615]
MAKQWLWGSLLGLAIFLPGPALAQTETPEAAPDAYTQAMNLGYAYSSQFDYQTALINFRRALEERPDDVYALNAIANVEYYIERNRVAAIQSEVNTLEAQLNKAAAAKDWVCVITTVDELIPYAEGLERERLTGYRSQLTGVLASQTDIDSWSTVCSPDQPLQ